MSDTPIQVGEQVIIDKGEPSERRGTVVDRGAVYYVVQLVPGDEVYVPEKHFAAGAVVVHPDNLTRVYHADYINHYRHAAGRNYDADVFPSQSPPDYQVQVPANARVFIIGDDVGTDEDGAWVEARVWVPRVSIPY